MTPLAAWLANVLHLEGWPIFTDRPADRGGPTKGGITLKTLSTWRGRPATVEELQDLPQIIAEQIYESIYWDPWAFVMNKPIQALLADWSVTSGVPRVVKTLQAVLDLRQDGVIGPLTVRRTSEHPTKADLYTQLWLARLRFYVGIPFNEGDVQEFLLAHPISQLHNLRGWVNRALSAPATYLTGGGRDAPNSS